MGMFWSGAAGMAFGVTIAADDDAFGGFDFSLGKGGEIAGAFAFRAAEVMKVKASNVGFAAGAGVSGFVSVAPGVDTNVLAPVSAASFAGFSLVITTIGVVVIAFPAFFREIAIDKGEWLGLHVGAYYASGFPGGKNFCTFHPSQGGTS